MNVRPDTTAPIGVFDSGVGGLSVLRALQAQLPNEQFVYYADTAFCPYGGRDIAAIRARAEAVSAELIAAGVKLIVVACNTATIAAIAHLRARFDLPFVGMEPGVKPAAETSRSRHIGVLATVSSLAGERFQTLVDAHARGVTVHTRACSGWVERVEAGDLASVACDTMLRGDVQPLWTRTVTCWCWAVRTSRFWFQPCAKSSAPTSNFSTPDLLSRGRSNGCSRRPTRATIQR